MPVQKGCAMYSMTGFGKGEYKEGGIELTVEIKTVNNRYLDVSVKAPKVFAAYEDRIRAAVRFVRVLYRQTGARERVVH